MNDKQIELLKKEIEFEENRFFPVRMANVGCE